MVSTPQTFECPNCGASLDYHDSDGPTIRCKYCSTSVVVPEELRSQADSPQVVMSSVNIQLGDIQAQQATTSSRSCLLVIMIMILSIGGLAAAIFLAAEDSPLSDLGLSDSGIASVSLRFGSEGIGQGMFEDARHIGIDGEGNIYVGEWDNGRIQVFDSTGQFLALWTMDNETPMVSMTVTRDGTLYAVHGINLWRYEGMTGEQLGQVAAGNRFEYVALTADGKLVTAVDDGTSDDIVRMDTQGNLEMRIPSALEGIAEHGDIGTMTVDGLGNIYVLPTFDDFVYKFSPDGQYLNRFGGDGDQAGQFTAPSALATDGQGRIYVTDFKGVQIFDNDGRYIDVFDFPGFGYGLTINSAGQVLVANGGSEISVFDLTLE